MQTKNQSAEQKQRNLAVMTSIDGAGGSIEEGIGFADLPDSDERRATDSRKVTQGMEKHEVDSNQVGVRDIDAKSSARAEAATAAEIQ